VVAATALALTAPKPVALATAEVVTGPRLVVVATALAVTAPRLVVATAPKPPAPRANGSSENDRNKSNTSWSSHQASELT